MFVQPARLFYLYVFFQFVDDTYLGFYFLLELVDVIGECLVGLVEVELLLLEGVECEIVFFLVDFKLLLQFFYLFLEFDDAELLLGGLDGEVVVFYLHFGVLLGQGLFLLLDLIHLLLELTNVGLFLLKAGV